jgi:uncharacterized protein YbcC (UPF0753/DUF2309 family)
MSKIDQSIREHVDEAFGFIAPLWPIDRFIAVNPLLGLQGEPFASALQKSEQFYNADLYLSEKKYLQLYAAGRITKEDLASARKSLNQESCRQSQMESPASKDFAQDPRATTLAELVQEATGHRVNEQLNREMIKWCSAFFDRGHAIWAMPYREKGLFAAWKALAIFDLTLPKAARQRLKTMPVDAVSCVEQLMEELAVPKSQYTAYFSGHIAKLPGWASYAKWCDSVYAQDERRPVAVDFIAIRLFLEVELSRPILQKAYSCPPNKMLLLNKFPVNSGPRNSATTDPIESDYQRPDNLERLPLSVWQEAFEINYRNSLLSRIRNRTSQSKTRKPARAQLVFCIDPRSEGLRRQLEALGDWKTIGFAGFFGFPVKFKGLGSQTFRSLCPVLIQPQKVITEKCNAPNSELASELSSARASRSVLLDLLHHLRSNAMAKFYFAEAAGPWCALATLAKTLFPALFKRLRTKFEPDFKNNLTLQISSDEDNRSGMSLGEQIDLAASTLKAIGLDHGSSPLVVLVGHGSSSENNAYASALNCGACGGSPGGNSARIATTILNTEAVRRGLAARGIEIAHSTEFLAAQHNTTTDNVVFYDEEKLSSANRKRLTQLSEDLSLSGERLRLERASSLNLSEIKYLPQQRALDWAQTRPEWGLARNAAFIVAKRELTESVNLERRVFLHEYSAENDFDGQALLSILNGPLVVAHWINMQYYLSTVDNAKFGSGSKATQNVVGNLGVMQGIASDLKIGLPWESVASDSSNLYHEPMRLLTIVEASRTLLDDLCKQSEPLAQLVRNRWIRLVCIEGDDFYEATSSGEWNKIPQEAETDSSLQLHDLTTLLGA